MQRIIRVGALNIVTHPHSAANYEKLIRKVYNRRKAARIRSDRFGMISAPSFPSDPSHKNAFVEGEVATFTRINAEGDWINSTTGQKAEDEDREAVDKLPRHLHPNYAWNRFRFYLKTHVLFFEVGNSSHRLTPNSAQALFSRLFSAPTIVDAFGDVEVTVIPQKDTLQQILSGSIRSLRVVVTKPNGDEGSRIEREFLRRLDDQGLYRVDSTYTAKRGATVKPDKELRAEASIAERNGRVDAVLIQHGKRIEVSTVDTPFIYPHEYDSKGMTAWDAFAQACEIARSEVNEDG